MALEDTVGVMPADDLVVLFDLAGITIILVLPFCFVKNKSKIQASCKAIRRARQRKLANRIDLGKPPARSGVQWSFSGEEAIRASFCIY